MTQTLFKVIPLVFALCASFLLIAPAEASENGTTAIDKKITSHAKSVCEGSLAAWLKSVSGTREGMVQELLADCLMGNARLTMLGQSKTIISTDARLTEIPAEVLKSEYGINTQIYRVLSGRWIRGIPREKE